MSSQIRRNQTMLKEETKPVADELAKILFGLTLGPAAPSRPADPSLPGDPYDSTG